MYTQIGMCVLCKDAKIVPCIANRCKRVEIYTYANNSLFAYKILYIVYKHVWINPKYSYILSMFYIA